MQSVPGSTSRRRFRASRFAVLLGISVLHVAGVALALMMKGPVADATAQTPAIQVVMYRESAISRPPEMPVLPPEFTPPQIVIPVVNIELPAPPPPTIAVVATPRPAPVPAAPAPAPASVADGDMNAPVAISNAEWVRKPSPVYPAAAKKARAQGVVEVRALVDVNGRALKASVHRSSGFAALDRAACDSVLASVFRPYLQNGVPRSVDVIVPITFALASRGGDRSASRGRDRDELELDVGSQDHHAMRGHAEELGSLGAAALQVGK